MRPTHETKVHRPRPEGKSHKLVVGLIGGMGSGKSRVAELFRQKGAYVISGDQLGHEALRRPDVIKEIVARWGKGVLDDKGQVDRPKVAEIVFREPTERRNLERMVFPWIEKRLSEEISLAEQAADCNLIVVDAAILLEAGWSRVCDRILYVVAPRADRLRRLAEQRGWTAEEVNLREGAQWPLSEKAAHADDTIDNGGTIEDTAHQIEALLEHWVEK